MDGRRALPIREGCVGPPDRAHVVTGRSRPPRMWSLAATGRGCRCDIVFQLGSAESVLSDEKELGVCVIDIGAGTTDVAVYNGGALQHTSFFRSAGGISRRTSPMDSRLRCRWPRTSSSAASWSTWPRGQSFEVPHVGRQGPRDHDRRPSEHYPARVEEIQLSVMSGPAHATTTCCRPGWS